MLRGHKQEVTTSASGHFPAICDISAKYRRAFNADKTCPSVVSRGIGILDFLCYIPFLLILSERKYVRGCLYRYHIAVIFSYFLLFVRGR